MTDKKHDLQDIHTLQQLGVRLARIGAEPELLRYLVAKVASLEEAKKASSDDVNASNASKNVNTQVGKALRSEFLRFVDERRAKKSGNANLAHRRLLSKAEQNALATQFAQGGDGARRLLHCQRFARGWLARRRFARRRKQASMRANIAREILSTEDVYCETLTALVNTYLLPLRDGGIAELVSMSADEVASLFGNIEEVFRFAQKMQSALRERLEQRGGGDWRTCVGDIFLQLCDEMSVFSAYCESYPNATRMLRDCTQQAQRYAAFNQWLRDASKSETPFTLLESLLIAPVQRLPRYCLLLRDLLKYTWETHADHAELSAAVDAVLKQADAVNAYIKVSKGAARVRDVARTVRGAEDLDSDPQRFFLRDGVLDMRRQDQSTLTKYHMYLFNDVILIATTSGRQQQLVQRLDLDSVVVKNVPDMKRVVNAFQLMNKNGSHIVVCSNHPEKTHWLNDLNHAINERRGGSSLKGSMGGDAGAVAAANSSLSTSFGAGVASVSADALVDAEAGGAANAAASAAARSAAPVTSVRIVGAETRHLSKEYSVYIIEVQAGAARWMIFKRFSDFDALSSALKRALPSTRLPPLPKKTFIRQGLSAKVMENRQIGLDAFLQELALRPELLQTEAVRDFLGVTSGDDDDREEVVTVHLVDNSKKTFKVAANASATQLCEMMARKLRQTVALDTYDMFVRWHDTERRIHADDRPLHVLRGWHSDARLYYKKGLFEERDLVETPMPDVDLHMLFIQALADVVSGRYVCDADTCVHLAALQCQTMVGSAGPSRSLDIATVLQRHVPPRLVKQHSAAKWEALINRAHQALRGDEVSKPELAYLRIVRAWHFYGAHIYDDVEASNIKEIGGGSGACRVAVKWNGVMVLDKDLQVLAMFEYNGRNRFDWTPTTFRITSPAIEWKFKTRRAYEMKCEIDRQCAAHTNR